MTRAAAASGMPPDDPGGFAEAHRQLLDDGAIQFVMHKAAAPAPPAWLKWLAELFGSRAGAYLGWIALALGAAVLILILARVLFGLRWPQRRARRVEPEESGWRPEETSARALLEEADRLAEAGRFDEAARLLLFRSIEEIEARRPRLVRPALTSRDIAGAPDIPAEPRQAFADIVMMVERSLFGGRSIAAPDWANCRSAYEQFAFAKAWQ